MGDWIDDIGDKLDGLQETRQHFDRVQLHNSEVIKAKAPARWQELHTAIEQSVDRWTQKMGGREERVVEFVRESDTKVIARKQFFPQRRLDVEFRLPAEEIAYSYTIKESAKAPAEKHSAEPLSFLVGSDNEVYLVYQRKTISIDDATKLLLTPVFNACS